MRKTLILALLMTGAESLIAQGVTLPKGAAYEVVLTCPPPASSADPIAGYEFFRAASGSMAYVLLNAAPVTTCGYTDITVPSNATEDYLVESVDAGGVTSAQGAMAAVPVPAVPTAPAVSKFSMS